MNQLIALLSVSCMGILTADAYIAVFGPKIRKPFTCGKCMTFWIGLVVFIIGTIPAHGISIAYVMTVLIEKYIWK